MENEDRRAGFTGFCKAAYQQYVRYMHFFYGGEYLHYGGEPTPDVINPARWTPREALEKAP